MGGEALGLENFKVVSRWGVDILHDDKRDVVVRSGGQESIVYARDTYATALSLRTIAAQSYVRSSALATFGPTEHCATIFSREGRLSFSSRRLSHSFVLSQRTSYQASLRS